MHRVSSTCLLIVKRFGSLREKRYISVHYYYYYYYYYYKWISSTNSNDTKTQLQKLNQSKYCFHLKI